MHVVFRIGTLAALLLMTWVALVGTDRAWAQDISGAWMDMETKTVFTITKGSHGYGMSIHDEDDGEPRKLLAANLQPQNAFFVYLTPSTGFVLVFDCTPQNGKLRCDWFSNKCADGVEILEPVNF